MAIMIPGVPLDYTEESKEDIIFKRLKDKLPPNVYVCHSLRIQFVDEKRMHVAEIDFLVLIPDVGAILIESKAGQIYPECKSGVV